MGQDYLSIDGVRVLLHEPGMGQHGVAPHAVLHTRVLIQVFCNQISLQIGVLDKNYLSINMSWHEKFVYEIFKGIAGVCIVHLDHTSFQIHFPQQSARMQEEDANPAPATFF